MKLAEAYPLQWPAGQKRTARRTRSRFRSAAFAHSRDDILRQLRLLGAKLPVISSNVPLRIDGLPYANMRQPEDPGIAVYFQWKGRTYCMACDKWKTTDENLTAIAKSIDALRGMERWRASDMMERAFDGFAALPAPDSVQSPWSVLGIPEGSSPDRIKQAYREGLLRAHPDKGGSHEACAKLTAAYRTLEMQGVV